MGWVDVWLERNETASALENRRGNSAHPLCYQSVFEIVSGWDLSLIGCPLSVLGSLPGTCPMQVFGTWASLTSFHGAPNQRTNPISELGKAAILGRNCRPLAYQVGRDWSWNLGDAKRTLTQIYIYPRPSLEPFWLFFSRLLLSGCVALSAPSHGNCSHFSQKVLTHRWLMWDVLATCVIFEREPKV